MKCADIHEDYFFCKFYNGIKLIRPEQDISASLHQPTLKDILHLPFSVYLLNQDGKNIKINEESAELCGFYSPSQSLGKSLFDVSKEESARKLIMNCKSVMISNEVRFFEEVNLRRDNLTQQFFSVKIPWYDMNNQVIGVLGFSIVLGTHSLAEGLATIAQLGVLQPKKPQNITLNGVLLTKREIECLRLTMNGYTAKKIAKKLLISYRTVEEYLTNIRIKTNINSKSELVELALLQGI